MKTVDGGEGLGGLQHQSRDALPEQTRIDIVLALAIASCWILILPRLLARHDGDRGIFVSIGERLLAGDTLYSGVWDKKDPLFFYLLAAERALGAWAELAAEAMLVGLAAASVYAIATMVASRWVAAAISFVAVPLILTGTFYVPGISHLPGIALALAAAAAAARGRPGLSGICLTLLLFTKLILMPVAVAAVGCFLLARRRPFEFVTCILSAGASTLAFLGLLAIRRELLPYIDAMIENVFYSRGTLLGGKTGLALIEAHFYRVNIQELGSELIIIALATAIALIPLCRLRHSNPVWLAVVGACILTTLASLFVVSMTGMWLHHNQVMYIPAIFATLALTPLFDLAVTVPRARLSTIAVVALTGYLLGGSIGPGQLARAFFGFPQNYASLSELSPETRRLLAMSPTGSYARLGGNDDTGHAIGLRRWKLVCARFAQYPFEPANLLEPVLECASKAPFLLVSASFAHSSGPNTGPAWNEFVSRGERMLAEDYYCDAKTGLRVCTRLAK